MCNQLDLQTLGSQPIMPRNLPDHCTRLDNFNVKLPEAQATAKI